MADLIISASEISDTYKTGGADVIPEIIRGMREAVNNGNKVIFRQFIEGSAPIDVKVISNHTELDQWEKEAEKFIIFLSEH